MEKDVQKVCKHHGLTNYRYVKSGNRYRCRACSVESVTKKRQALKQKLVDYLGGCCTQCGYDSCIDALHFHHREKKDATISSLIGSYRAKKVWKEIEKCELLCANCHAEVHYKMRRTGIEPVSLGLQPSA